MQQDSGSEGTGNNKKIRLQRRRRRIAKLASSQTEDTQTPGEAVADTSANISVNATVTCPHCRGSGVLRIVIGGDHGEPGVNDVVSGINTAKLEGNSSFRSRSNEHLHKESPGNKDVVSGMNTAKLERSSSLRSRSSEHFYEESPGKIGVVSGMIPAEFEGVTSSRAHGKQRSQEELELNESVPDIRKAMPDESEPCHDVNEHLEDVPTIEIRQDMFRFTIYHTLTDAHGFTCSRRICMFHMFDVITLSL